MSYAGPASRSRGSSGSSHAAGSRTAGSRTAGTPPAAARAPARIDPLQWDAADGDTHWQQVALFGAGLALGIAIGAGAALLAAPRTGAETRAAFAGSVSRTARRGTRRTRDAWEDLRDELLSVRRMLRRRRAGLAPAAGAGSAGAPPDPAR